MAVERTIAIFEEEVRVLAQVNIGKVWDRVLGEFLGEWERLDRQQLSNADLARELESFMDGLSVKPTEALARKSSTVAYNQGRNAELISARDAKDVQFVVRSEVLDTGTCRPCTLLDGELFEVGSSEYYANMPPAQCDGQEFCRGFYIPISAEAAA